MRRMATAMLHDDDMAADAVQETLARLWHRRWRLGMMSNPQGFCMTSLRNHCIDLLRQRPKTTLTSLADNDIADYDNSADDIEERYRKLEQAIASLAPRQQELIRLKYVEQRSVRDIAHLTGLSETNVTSTLSRIYTTLRNKMKDGERT